MELGCVRLSGFKAQTQRYGHIVARLIAKHISMSDSRERPATVKDSLTNGKVIPVGALRRSSGGIFPRLRPATNTGRYLPQADILTDIFGHKFPVRNKKRGPLPTTPKQLIKNVRK